MEDGLYDSDFNIWITLDSKEKQSSFRVIHWIKWDSEFCFLLPLMKPLVGAGLFGDAYRDNRISYENLDLVKSSLENIRQELLTMPTQVEFRCRSGFRVIGRKKSGKPKFAVGIHQISMKQVLMLHRNLTQILQKAEDKRIGIVFSGD
jgi:hypothetical protein